MPNLTQDILSVYSKISSKVKNKIYPNQCEIIASLIEIDDPKYYLLDGRVFEKDNKNLFVCMIYSMIGDSFSSLSDKSFDRTTHFAIPDLRGRYLTNNEFNVFKPSIYNANIQGFSIESKNFFSNVIKDGFERRKKIIENTDTININSKEGEYEDIKYLNTDKLINNISGDDDNERPQITTSDKAYYFYIKIKNIFEDDDGYCLFEDKLYLNKELTQGEILYYGKLYNDGIEGDYTTQQPYPAQYPDRLGYYTEQERPDDQYTYKSYRIQDGLIYATDHNGVESLYDVPAGCGGGWLFGNVFHADGSADGYYECSFKSGRSYFLGSSSNPEWGYIYEDYFNSDKWTNPNGGYNNNGLGCSGYFPKHLASHLKFINGYVCNLDGTKYSGSNIFKRWNE